MYAFCFSGQIPWRKCGTESLGSSPGLSRKIPTPETSHTAPVTVSIFCFCSFHAWCQRLLDFYVRLYNHINRKLISQKSVSAIIRNNCHRWRFLKAFLSLTAESRTWGDNSFWWIPLAFATFRNSHILEAYKSDILMCFVYPHPSTQGIHDIYFILLTSSSGIDIKHDVTEKIFIRINFCWIITVFSSF